MKKAIIKFLVLTIILVFLVGLCACNYQYIDLNLKFTNAYVKIGEQWIDLEIKTWRDYEGEQIQLTLKDDTVLIVHSANCVLYNGELPNN